MAIRRSTEEYRLAELSLAFSPLFRRRLKAMRLLREGLSVPAVAALLGVSRQSVYAWVARYELNGINGLVDRRRSGRPGIITEAYVQVLLETLCSLELLPPEGWQADPLREYMRQQTGITVSRCRFYRLLHSLGYAFHSVNLYQGNVRVWSGYTWIRTQGLPHDGITVFLRCEVTSYQSLPDTAIPREEKRKKHIVRVFSVRRLVRHVPIAVSRRSKTPSERRLDELGERSQRRRREDGLARMANYDGFLKSLGRRRRSRQRRQHARAR